MQQIGVFNPDSMAMIPKPALNVGDTVSISGNFSEKVGKIVGLNDAYPDQAEVVLTHGDGSTTKIWIGMDYLSKITNPAISTAAEYKKYTSSTGYLYEGKETVFERGMKVGDVVQVSNYSEDRGRIVELSATYPFEAKVELAHKDGKVTSCWIDSKNLAK